jgi:hypothetical protein
MTVIDEKSRNIGGVTTEPCNPLLIEPEILVSRFRQIRNDVLTRSGVNRLPAK